LLSTQLKITSAKIRAAIGGSVLLLYTIASLAFATYGLAQSTADREIPTLQGGARVYDETNTLTPGEIAQLDLKLKAFEDSTTTQIIVVMIGALGNNEISEYAIEVGRHNKVGQAKKNNGAIVLIAKDARKAWIATGMGLEASLTDLEAGLIYREVLRPGLQTGNFYDAIDSTTAAIMLATAGEYKADPRKTPPTSKDGPSGMGVITFIIIFFVIITILRSLFGRGHRRTIVGSRKNRSGCGGGGLMEGLLWASVFNAMSGGRSGGFSGGGFGGGGFGGGGGFSGGGGSFGGGGAGGDW
jgi:uncharacterized protein